MGREANNFLEKTGREVNLREAVFLVIINLMATILGIETSCDETSAAVVHDGRLLSNVTTSQVFHSRFGGVVPELASRAHQRLIVPVVDQALQESHIRKSELTGVAAVYGPGLIGSLLVGLSFGKSLALGLGVPFFGINHMEAHILSHLIEDPRPSFPFVNLTISGGHTQLVLVREPFEYVLLGETRDDAVGEAFDKVAKMLGLGYPGGPLVDELAKKGNPQAIKFPRPYVEDKPFEFSFSGIKTSVLYYLKGIQFESSGEAGKGKLLPDLCASFQAAVVDVLIHKLMNAARVHGVSDIAVAGGVAANSELRKRLKETAEASHRRLFIPRFEYCTDNGAMVAMAGYLKAQEGISSDYDLAAIPNLEIASPSRS